MQKIFFIAASVFGGLAVALGAYGAHGGAEIINQNDAIITFGKAVRYQMHHALVLFVVVWALSQAPSTSKILTIVGWLFISGIILFSGSLYIISFTGISMGYLTPLGGISFVLGWGLLAYSGYKMFATK